MGLVLDHLSQAPFGSVEEEAGLDGEAGNICLLRAPCSFASESVASVASAVRACTVKPTQVVRTHKQSILGYPDEADIAMMAPG